MLVVIGWAICFISATNAEIPDIRHHYMDAAGTHVTISWICTILILIAGITDFGTSPLFPKFITYDAED